MTILHFLNRLDLLWSHKWRTGGPSYRFYSDESELLQLVWFVQLKNMTGSGGVIIFEFTKIILPAFCWDDHTTPFDHPWCAWISKMTNWRPVIQVLFRWIIATQLASFVQLKDIMTGSWGVSFGLTKLFLPVFCRDDHTLPFKHHWCAWIAKIANWRPVLQVLFRRIRAISASELCPIEWYDWIWRSHYWIYEIIFTSILLRWPYYTFWSSSICLDLKNGELEVRLTGYIPTNQSYFS